MHAATAPRIDEPHTTSRNRRIGMLAALAVAQLFAFWLLCSHQVRKAETRHAEWQVQQLALSDCLEYIPGSTIGSCSNAPLVSRVGGLRATDAAPANTVTGAMPVSFTYR